MFDQDNLMLNRAEFAQLQSTLLSHMARTLYIFYIQPIARSGQLIVDPIAMTKQLISISSYAPCNPSLKDVEQALLELEQINLIKRAPGTISWQGAHVILPLFVMETNFVPSRPFQMFPSWQPSASYPTVALQAGLIDYHYQDHELQSFISFWITRTLSRNQQAWERSFVMRLLKVRSAQTVKSYDRKNNDSSFAGYSSSTQPNAYVPNPLAYNQSTPSYTETETETYDESYGSYDIPSSIFNSDYEQTPPIFPNPFNDGPLSGNASSGNVPYQSDKAQGGFNNFSKSQQNIPERNSAIAKYAYKMSEAKLRDLERREREYNEKRNQIDYSARSEDTKRQVAQMLSLTNHHQQNLAPTANQAPQSSPAQAMALAQANGQTPAQGQAKGMAQAPAPAATTAAPTGAKAGATGQVLPADKANVDYGSMAGQTGEQALQMHSEQGSQQSGEQSGEPMMVASERDFGHQDVSSEPGLEYGQDNSVYNSRSESRFDTGGGVDMQELYARYDSVYTKHNDPKSRVNKPTLFALATGKEDFESIAPGYTDPELQEQKRQLATGQEQALYSGYEPLTVAKDYTPSKVNDNISSSLLNEDSSCTVADAGLLTTAEAMEKAFFGSSARTICPSEQEQALQACHEGKPLSESAAYWCGAKENLEPIRSEQEHFGRTIEGTVGNSEPLGTLAQPFDNTNDASAELITPMDLSAPMDLTGNMAELSSNSDLTGATWSRDYTDSTNPTEFTEFDKTAGAAETAGAAAGAAAAEAAGAAGIARADGISGASWANGSAGVTVAGWANEAMESAGDESWYISEPSVEERATQGFDKSFLAELSSEFKKN